MSFELFCCDCKAPIYPYVAFRSKDESNVFATAICRECWEIEEDVCDECGNVHENDFEVAE
jgi:hypothetical protein